MGRTRRYTKIKAADPFSKKKNTDEKLSSRDDPPDKFYDRKKKKHEKIDHRFDDSETMIESDAIRQIETTTSKTDPRRKIEEKREGESMKMFKQRVKQQTREILCDELRKLSKTSQKRKERLKERKRKRKESKSNAAFEDGDEEFRRNEEGDDEVNEEFEDITPQVPTKLRKSDLGGSTSFSSAEYIPFGETALQPPNIQKFLSMTKKKPKDHSKQPSENVSNQPKSKSFQMTKVLSASELKSGLIHAGSQVKPNEREMEILRNKVQEAYKKVKENRMKLKKF